MKTKKIELTDKKSGMVKQIFFDNNKINKITNYKRNEWGYYEKHGLEIFFDENQKVIKQLEWENGFKKNQLDSEIHNINNLNHITTEKELEKIKKELEEVLAM